MSYIICGGCDSEFDTDAEWEHHKQVCEKYKYIVEAEQRIATLTAERDALHQFAHGVMVACVEAGGASGDTTVQLANVRALVKERDALRADLTKRTAELQRVVEAAQALHEYILHHPSLDFDIDDDVYVPFKDALANVEVPHDAG